jgi:hypothetical protein
MNEKQRAIMIHNVLSTADGRLFILDILSKCGVNLNEGISYRIDKTAHEVGLDLLQEIMYNHVDELKKLISDDKTLKEVLYDRGNNTDE